MLVSLSKLFGTARILLNFFLKNIANLLPSFLPAHVIKYNDITQIGMPALNNDNYNNNKDNKEIYVIRILLQSESWSTNRHVSFTLLYAIKQDF